MCTLYTVQCTLYTVQCTLYSVYLCLPHSNKQHLYATFVCNFCGQLLCATIVSNFCEQLFACIVSYHYFTTSSKASYMHIKNAHTHTNNILRQTNRIAFFYNCLASVNRVHILYIYTIGIYMCQPLLWLYLYLTTL